MSIPAIIRGRILLLVRTHARNMYNHFRRNIHRYFDELMNTDSKYMIIGYNMYSSNSHQRIFADERKVCLTVPFLFW